MNIETTKNNIINWIREWFAENGPDSPAVIGISGGKDSSVVAALCCEALGKERVIGVLMPNGEQPDIDYAKALVNYLDIKYEILNIQNTFKSIKESLGMKLSEQAEINLQPRIRMVTLYALSQSVNGRVSNNSNLSERYLGYSTKYGDSAGDFAPIANLTATEVVMVGRSLGLPDVFVKKAPSDGLTGKTDEDNFGFTYTQLDQFIRTGICEDETIKEKILKRHNQNLFKLKPMAEFKGDR